MSNQAHPREEGQCDSQHLDADVLIAGAGPTGLVLANLLGEWGIRVIIADERQELITYPRAVGLDDDSLRVFQEIGIVDAITPHIIPGHYMRVVDANDRILATLRAKGSPNGYTRKNAFHQGVTDTQLALRVQTRPTVDFRLSSPVSHVRDAGDHITATVGTSTVTARWLVACDGGRSPIRKGLGIAFPGSTEPTRWLVIDLANDPVGSPGGVLGADPRRPYVSICLPGGMRRFEFLLHPGEKLSDEFVDRLLEERIGRRVTANVIRYREYSHHSRIAERFRSGRIILAGDAAHLMPVWLGQGMNSGIRDATNLAWKLAGIVRGEYSAHVLDSYEHERREHVRAMVERSTQLGRFVAMEGRKAKLRDVGTRLARRIPAARELVEDMRFKPAPRLSGSLVVGGAPAGTMLPQPVVRCNGQDVLLDDALGTGWRILTWGAAVEERWPSYRVVPLGAYEHQAAAEGSAPVIGDHGALRDWFDEYRCGAVILRPDRYVAATCQVAEIPSVVTHLRQALGDPAGHAGQ